MEKFSHTCFVLWINSCSVAKVIVTHQQCPGESKSQNWTWQEICRLGKLWIINGTKQYLTLFIIYLCHKNFTIFLWEAIWYCTTFSLFITSLKCLHHIAHQSKYKIFLELNSISGVHIVICYTPTFKLYAGLHIVKLVSFYPYLPCICKQN